MNFLNKYILIIYIFIFRNIHVPHVATLQRASVRINGQLNQFGDESQEQVVCVT